MTRDEWKTLAAGLLASAAVLILGGLSSWWIFSVMGPPIRNAGLEILFLPGVAVIVFGTGAAWYLIYSWLYDRFGLR